MGGEAADKAEQPAEPETTKAAGEDIDQTDIDALFDEPDPTEAAPAEEPAAEEATDVEAAAEETPAEDAPAEQAPEDATPTDEAPADEAPAKDAAAADATEAADGDESGSLKGRKTSQQEIDALFG